jgi:hypothetical protein
MAKQGLSNLKNHLLSIGFTKENKYFDIIAMYYYNNRRSAKLIYFRYLSMQFTQAIEQ